MVGDVSLSSIIALYSLVGRLVIALQIGQVMIKTPANTSLWYSMIFVLICFSPDYGATETGLSAVAVILLNVSGISSATISFGLYAVLSVSSPTPVKFIVSFF